MRCSIFIGGAEDVALLINFTAESLVLQFTLSPLLALSLRHLQEDEDSELKSLITSFKNMTGLWDIDPEDSAWYHLEQKDKNDPSIVIPMGSICYRYVSLSVYQAQLCVLRCPRSDAHTFLANPLSLSMCLRYHSVQIWPKDKALVMQAGAARNEPNSNPFCPPPVGRFKFSW